MQKKDNRIFVICEKCGRKITTYAMVIENPKEIFTFAIRCRCGNAWNYSYGTNRARKMEMQKKTIDMLNPEVLKKLGKKLGDSMMGSDK